SSSFWNSGSSINQPGKSSETVSMSSVASNRRSVSDNSIADLSTFSRVADIITSNREHMLIVSHDFTTLGSRLSSSFRTQNPAGFGPQVFAAPDDELAVDDHRIDPLGILVRVFERRLVDDLLEIEEHDIGGKPVA